MSHVNSKSTSSEIASPTVGPWNYAGFWVRVVAGLIDLILLLIPFSTIVSFAAVGMNVWYSFFFDFRPERPMLSDLAQKGPLLVTAGVTVFILSGWLYVAFLEGSSWRGTLGKHMLGLYIGDEQGERIGFWQASKRFVGGRLLLHVPVIGIYYFLVDCLCITVHPRKRANHDVLSGCLVLRESLDIKR